MNTGQKPFAKVEDGRLDIQFNQQKSVTGNSEQLRGWAEKRFNRFDWSMAWHNTAISAAIGLFSLYFAWLLAPIAPAYHLFIRWGLVVLPIILVAIVVAGIRLNVGNRAFPDWSKHLLFASFGLILTWLAHRA